MMEIWSQLAAGTSTMMWIQIATGFTGAMTLMFLLRLLYRQIAVPPSIAAYHSPKGGCTEAVVRELAKARQEIFLLAYSFTSKPIADALVAAKGRGVHVEVVLDHSNEKEEYTVLPHLLEQGISTLIDAEHAIAHNKVVIVDRRTLITGSFNFTHQAEAENAENLLIIQGHPELAQMYCENYLAHKGHSRQPVHHEHALHASKRAA